MLDDAKVVVARSDLNGNIFQSKEGCVQIEPIKKFALLGNAS